MNIPWPALIILGLIALLAIPIVLRTALAFFVRFVGGELLVALGQKALAMQPDHLDLRKAAPAPWRDPARIEALTKPLFEAGFSDCGVYETPKMLGVRVWFLLKEADSLAAFVYEHPKTNSWVELSTRYNDGTTFAVSNLPATGIKLEAPFYRKISVDPATSTGEMVKRMLAERSPFGVKSLTPVTVVEEFELAYAKIIVWQKNKGLSAEEVGTVVKKWAEKRKTESTGVRPEGPAGSGAGPA